MTHDKTELPNFSWTEVCAMRLDRHALSAPSQDARPADVVRTICGAHAQVMSAAELSIGLRIADAKLTDVREALWTEHSLVKTYGPRGTVHLMPTQDLPMWTGALSAIPSGPNSLSEDVRLSPEQTDEIVEAIAVALDDSELTVDELGEAIVAATGHWAGELSLEAWQGMWPRWRQAVGTAANRGVLCFGPNQGTNVTYTNPRRWLSSFRPAPTQTALADVIKRYLYAYGPATPQQFAQWLNAPVRWTAELFDSLSGEIQQVEVEGSISWLSTGDLSMPSGHPRGVRLLPYFDAYTVGCHPRARVFPGQAAKRALSRGQAGNFPVLLIEGIAAGVWHQRRSGRKIEITVEPFGRLTATQRRELDDQVARIGEFLERKPQLTIGAVPSGGHA